MSNKTKCLLCGKETEYEGMTSYHYCKQEDRETTRMVVGAVRVKNAVLMKTGSKYVLQHYSTVILEIENGDITLIKKGISQSSNRAIKQALEYLRLEAKA